jgi:hypothetical protein
MSIARTRIALTAALASGTLLFATACASSTGGASGISGHSKVPVVSHRAAPPTAASLTTALKNAGLPVHGVIVYTAATDANHLLGRQGEYTSKTAWTDPAAHDPGAQSGDTAAGGGIEAFSNSADAATRLHYLQAFKPPFGDGYDYQAGSAVLRLSNFLTPTQAARYKAAFTKAATH